MPLFQRPWHVAFTSLALLGALQGTILLVDRIGDRSRATRKTLSTVAVDNPVDSEDHRASSQHSSSYYRPPEHPSPYPNEFEGVWARPFLPWPTLNRTLPCPEPNEDWHDHHVQLTPSDEGIFFQKPYKTGSSTASGVNIRIARNVAQRRNQSSICKARFHHAKASRLYPTRSKQNSFAWSILRDPTSRLVSQFFHFEVSRAKKEPSDANFRKMALGDNEYVKNHYLEYLGREEHMSPSADALNGILEDYDFLGVTERMDESVVALSMVAGVPLADVLFLKAKGHGGYDDGGGRGEKICTYIWPSFVSDGMREFFVTDEFQDVVHWDWVLYQAVNRSLDMTIEMLGPEFDAKLELYRKAQALAHERCLPATTFPCSEGGVYNWNTDCMWNDSACGMDCLDEVATELGLWE